MSDPTPITTDEPAPEPMTLEEARERWAVFCAALREVGMDLKAQQEAEAA